MPMMRNKPRGWTRGLYALLGLLSLVGCARNPEHCRWGLLVNGLAPMLLLEARFTLPDGRQLALDPTQPEAIGVGFQSSTLLRFQNEDYRPRPLPSRLEISWYDRRQNRIYGGTIELPQDRLRERFLGPRVSYQNGRRSSFADLKLCLGPDGEVHVYLWNRYDVVLFDSYAVPEIGRNISSLNEVQRAALDEARQGGTGGPTLIWSQISQTFPLRIECRSEARLQSAHFFYANGEIDFINARFPSIAVAPQDAERPRAIPIKLEVFWKNQRGLAFDTFVELSRAEIARQLGDLPAGATVSLVLEVDASGFIDSEGRPSQYFEQGVCRVALLHGEDRIELKQVEERSSWYLPNYGVH